MIYVLSLDTSDFQLIGSFDPDASYYKYYTYSSTNLSNAWGLILDSKVYYGPISTYKSSGTFYAFGHNDYSGTNYKYASEGGAVLPEGWYINYMGLIYDYQGNIVE